VNQENQRSAFERDLTARLHAETGRITAACPDRDTLRRIAGREISHNASVAVLSHVALCAYCRRAYTEVAREIESGWITSRPVLSENVQLPRHQDRSSDSLGFDWSMLQAATHSGSGVREEVEVYDPRTITTLLLEGRLRVTLWLDGERVVLTAEQTPGVADDASLSKCVIQYRVSSGRHNVEGFLVLSDASDINSEPAAAEINLGVYSEILTGELECWIATLNDETDPELIRKSLDRVRDEPSLRSWQALAEKQSCISCSDGVREVVRRILEGV
jgi:hypothetical protein